MKLIYNTEQLARLQIYYNPAAGAELRGSEEYSDIIGELRLYNLHNGVLAAVSVSGLPKTESGFFAFHLHDGTSCSGNKDDSFADAGVHYNPDDSPHPEHAGDFPPLLYVNGSSYLSFVTDRFAIKDVIGKAVIIHLMPDDFKTQPSGGAGTKIACGIIRTNTNP